jgi:hypothetical protein
MKPSFRQPLLPSDCRGRYSQGNRSFIDTQTAEEAQLNDFRFPFIDLLEPSQRIVKSDDVAGLLGSEADDLVDRHLLDAAAAFCAPVFARVIDKYLAHEVSSHPEEMSPAFPIGHTLRHQPQISFMNKRGGLQSGCRPFIPEISFRQPPKLIVNKRRQQIHRRLISLLPLN